MHIESSKLLVDEFARLVLPLGTTAVVADPHEIANVLGTDGVHWLLDACAEIPLDVYFMASSCVPASSFESPRRELTTGDLEGLLRRRARDRARRDDELPRRRLGLRARAREARARAGTSTGTRRACSASSCNAYAAAGIRSDHEAFTAEEGRERLRAGMWLLIREASARAQPACAAAARRRVRAGPDRVLHRRPRARARRRRRARQLDGARRGRARGRARRTRSCWRRSTRRPTTGSTISARSRPATRPTSCSCRDLVDVRAGARPQGADGRSARSRRRRCPTGCATRCASRTSARTTSSIPWQGGAARVIGLVPNQIVTASLVEEPTVETGSRSPTRRATWPRSRCSSATSAPAGSALGFVRGFGLQRGAFGATVAHDAHNIVVVGVDDAAMARAVGRLRELGGGIVVVEEQGVRAELPLPVAGLLSDRAAAEVLEASRAISTRPRQLGVHVPGAVPDARVPGAVGDPVAEDHRPRPRRRRPLRAGAAGGP